MTSGINALVVKSEKFEVATNNNSRVDSRSNDDKSFEQVFDETNRNNDSRKVSSKDQDSADEKISRKNTEDTNEVSVSNDDTNQQTQSVQETNNASTEFEDANTAEESSFITVNIDSPLLEEFISDLQLESDIDTQPVGFLAASNSALLKPLSTVGIEANSESGIEELTLLSGFNRAGNNISNNSLLNSNYQNTPLLQSVTAQTSELNNAEITLDFDTEVLSGNLQNSKLSGKFDNLLNLASLNSASGIDATNAIDNKVSQYINGQLNGVLNPSEAFKSSPVATNLLVGHSINSPAWGADVAEKVLWLASQGLTEAEIQLDPPELGPLQARITVNNDQAHVSFNSHSSLVRDALDQTANRLRELFSQEGLNLVDVNVSGQSNQEQRQEGNGKPANDNIVSSGLIDENTEITHTTPVNTRTSLVDSYA